VFVPPGLEPSGHVIDFGPLLISLDVGEGAHGDDGFILTKDSGFQVIRQIYVIFGAIGATEVSQAVAVVALATYGQVFQTDKGLGADYLQFEAN